MKTFECNFFFFCKIRIPVLNLRNDKTCHNFTTRTPKTKINSICDTSSAVGTIKWQKKCKKKSASTQSRTEDRYITSVAPYQLGHRSSYKFFNFCDLLVNTKLIWARNPGNIIHSFYCRIIPL